MFCKKFGNPYRDSAGAVTSLKSYTAKDAVADGSPVLGAAAPIPPSPVPPIPRDANDDADDLHTGLSPFEFCCLAAAGAAVTLLVGVLFIVIVACARGACS